jgi:hypothetical protein
MNMKKKILILILIFIVIIILINDNLIIKNCYKNYKNKKKYYETPFFEVENIDKKFVQRGKEIALNKKIILCGLCRDIESVISKNINFCEQIGSQFYDYRIILFENDSKDNTRNIISEYSKKNSKIILLDCPNVIDCKFGDKKMYDYGSLSLTRMSKMAYFRNQYIDTIKKKFYDFDYVMMLDMDIEGYFNMDGLMEVISKEEWDIVFCNGRSPIPGTFGLYEGMYDGLAYLDKEDSYENCQNEKSVWKLLNVLLGMQFLKDKWNKVKSAFNGCGIYKMNVIKNITFPSNYNCEWIGFHHEAFKQGFSNFFIARDWKLYVGIQGDSNRLSYFF